MQMLTTAPVLRQTQRGPAPKLSALRWRWRMQMLTTAPKLSALRWRWRMQRLTTAPKLSALRWRWRMQMLILIRAPALSARRCRAHRGRRPLP